MIAGTRYSTVRDLAYNQPAVLLEVFDPHIRTQHAVFLKVGRRHADKAVRLKPPQGSVGIDNFKFGESCDRGGDNISDLSDYDRLASVIGAACRCG